jgi:hypothetical protein
VCTSSPATPLRSSRWVGWARAGGQKAGSFAPVCTSFASDSRFCFEICLHGVYVPVSADETAGMTLGQGFAVAVRMGVSRTMGVSRSQMNLSLTVHPSTGEELVSME